MKISLDFDDTYTRDPDTWNLVIAQLQLSGHQVYCVTYRTPEQGLEVLSTIGRVIGVDNCYFTSSQSKQAYMRQRGHHIDVWIDDMPISILEGIDTDLNDGEIYD